MKKGLKILVTLCFAIAFTQCNLTNTTENIPIERAVYYWQTTMNFDTKADLLANNLNISTIYVRYFDIDWSYEYKSGIPVGVLNGDMQWTKKNVAHFGQKNIIPTIFITNRTFKNIDEQNIDELADNTIKKIDQITGQLQQSYVGSMIESDNDSGKYETEFLTMISEIQIDCDWTASTKDKFFHFLKTLQSKIGDKPLSCTIRLHQYRDRKLMGIPPVNRGLLMCYNVAEVQKYDTKNAILDVDVVKQYLINKKYPIKLDIGLPMFSWAAWYQGTEFKGIVSGWNEQDAADKSLYRLTQGNRYLVSSDTVLGTHYLREGDLLRWDNSSEIELNNTIDILIKKLDLSGVRIAFFDWENEKIKRHENELETYYSRFE